MPNLSDFGARLQIPVEEVVRIGEQQVQNPNSQVYKTIVAKIGQKLAAAHASHLAGARKTSKQRVYIQHAVSSTDRYTLVSEFPQWDIRFSAVDMRAAALAHAVFVLVAEEMIAQISVKKGSMLVYGISMKQIVMRNRKWMHLCVPGHVADVQAEFFKDDRAIAAMVDSSARKGKEPGLARNYIAGDAGVHCTTPHRCEHVARAAVMSLHKTDTNFRQLACYMNMHSTDVLFFSVPGCKAMEMCTTSVFPELDAYVFPTEGGKRINIAYKNDATLDMSYTYSNYLELIARVQVVIGGRCFRKEFFGRRLGMLMYKVTAFDAKYAEVEPQMYRSWIDPGYKDKYMIYAPMLRPGGNVSRAEDYDLPTFAVDKTIVDTVFDHAMRVQGVKDMAREIERRLYTMTSNHILMNQIVNSGSALTVTEFDLLALVVYCVSYMQKFKDGKTVSALAPQAREVASLAKASMPSLMLLYLNTMVSRTFMPLARVKSSLRAAYYDTIRSSDMPMPAFTLAPGYVEYTDTASGNPRFNGWLDDSEDPTAGFSSLLPGMDAAVFLAKVSSLEQEFIEPVEELTAWDYLAGDVSTVADDSTLERSTQVTLLSKLYEGVTGILEAVPDVDTMEQQFQIEHTGLGDVDAPRKATTVVEMEDTDRYRMGSMIVREEMSRNRLYTPKVDELVNKITKDHVNLSGYSAMSYVQHMLFGDRSLPLQVPAAGSADPVSDLREALGLIFAGSTAMNTSDFESDKVNSTADIVIKGIKTKIDVSKMEQLKPESAYKPIVSSHAQPNVKNNLLNTLITVEKRNANTPNDADMLDIDMLWRDAWRASLSVYYVDGAQGILDSLPYIGPDERHIREWVSRLSQEKLEKLLKESEIDGFAFSELISGMQNNAFMLKSKLKPKLDSTYGTAVPTPQSLQYDQSGKVVAVYTPVFSQKVEREQSILKPNILVLQRKSKAEVDKFLCQFDWRDNQAGQRRYFEGDYTQFDKTQSDVAAALHYRKCAIFGILKQYVEFFDIVTKSRTVSSVKAGVKQWLRSQNPSGFPNTLDRNNDVNMLAMAVLLDRILSYVEFIIFMGDDFIVAIRGTPNIVSWESEINRKYNLNVKLAIHDHGYICSMDIVHLPDGKSRVVSDVVKRGLSLTQHGYPVDTPFDEMFTSYADITDGVQDANVQSYLSTAVAGRMSKYLPGATPYAIALLCRVHTALRSDFKKYRSMFSESTVTRYA